MPNLVVYESNYQCIRDHLQHLNLVLAKMLLVREKNSKELYISQEEVWEVMDHIEEFVQCDNEQLISSIEEAKKIISTRRQMSIEKHQDFPFLKLHSLFELNEDEIFIVSMLLSCFINPKYKTIYAYLNNDITQKIPTVDLVLDTISRSSEERFTKQRYFHSSSPLIRNQILHVDNNNLSLDSRFKDWLFCIDCIDMRVKKFIEIYQPKYLNISPQELINIPTNQITWLTGICLQEKVRWIHHLTQREVIVCYLDEILLQNDFYSTLDLVFREVRLRKACVFFGNGSAVSNHALRDMLMRYFRNQLVPMYFCGENLCGPEYEVYHVSIPKYKERLQIWNLFVKNSLKDTEVDSLAKKYSLSFSQIKMCFDKWKTKNKTLAEICKEFVAPKKSNLIEYVAPHYKWKDAVFSKSKKQELKEISYCIEHKDFVLNNWNFQSKLAGKQGINVVFSGGPGTGKTMTANILAGSNKMSLYKIDTASIVDKYIGETEKKLKVVFEQVENTNSILFFDEADSLFGKRGEVQRAQDRYANVTVSYLLQKIEEHSGVIILATNLVENLDKAFVRRMNFVVQFPHPNTKQRVGIWKKIFPEEVPKKNIDYAFLADKVNLSGGYIKNIAWLACFYAAKQDKVLQMSHIIQSIRREYQKIGKAFLDSDFAPYV
ncbi:ATP-binding protein [Candidatus Uabimicrobium sp. HlEnr_7]|uniref:ATP-binding protein n=1 Tax=Candidatus Uabimicrobium helgolandensis TaxID=3095367 RepID=UPI003557F644